MENFNQIFTLLANEGGIGLNTDILETGLINIIVLVGILIYTGKDFLGSLLEERKTTIVNSVQDAEDRLNEAQKRLDEAQKQLNQVNVIISEIKNETLKTKKALLNADSTSAQKDLQTKFERAFTNFQTKERQTFLEIRERIVVLVLTQTVARVKIAFAKKNLASAYLSATIQKIEGELD